MVLPTTPDVLAQDWVYVLERDSTEQLERELAEVHSTPLQVLGVERLWEELLTFVARADQVELFDLVWERL